MLSTTVDRDTDQAQHVGVDTSAADDLLRGVFDVQRFDPARLTAAARSFPLLVEGQRTNDSPGIGLREGRTFTLSISPGVVALAVSDSCRVERAVERAGLRQRRDVDLEARRWVDVGLLPVERDTSMRSITEWSARSRSRMVRAFGEVDWSALIDPSAPLGMVTLTYSGDWLSEAPSGKAVKRHLRILQLRWKRATGQPLRGAWKLEFQRRGAPHVHIICPCPAMVGDVKFEAWLSKTWWQIVEPTFPDSIKHLFAGTAVDFAKTGRMTDPKRLGVYFMKHSTKTADDKEYQHIVPDAWREPGKGPGRFWGFWGMEKATEAVELRDEDFYVARRVMRKAMHGKARRIAHDRAYYAALKDWGDPVRAARIARAAADRVPRRWTLGSSGALTGGFLVVNDGATFGHDLARAVMLARAGRCQPRVGGSLLDVTTGELVL